MAALLGRRGGGARRRPRGARPDARRPPRLGPGRRFLRLGLDAQPDERRPFLVRIRRPAAAVRRPPGLRQGLRPHDRGQSQGEAREPTTWPAPARCSEPSRRRRCPAASPRRNSGLRRAFWSLTEQGPGVPGRPVPESIPSSSRACGPTPDRAGVINWLWLALANQRLGKDGEARRWLSMAQAWLDQYGDGMPARAEGGSGCTCTTGWKPTSYAARRSAIPSHDGNRIAVVMKSSYLRRQAGDFPANEGPMPPGVLSSRPPSEESFA